MQVDSPIVSFRQKELVQSYVIELDRHLDELKEGKAERTLEIRDFADLLHVHPTHLSNTLHDALGTSPCDLYEQRLLKLAKELLTSTKLPIGQIAHQLCYDPSNFTKFFKNYEGMTPKQFRLGHTKI